MEPCMRKPSEIMEDLLREIFTIDTRYLPQNQTPERPETSRLSNRSFTAKYSPKDKSKFHVKNDSKIICWFCGKKGHIERKCWKKQSLKNRPRCSFEPSPRNSNIEFLRLISEVSQLAIRNNTIEVLFTIRAVINTLIETYLRQS